MNYLRLLRTLRYLQYRQIGWRAWYYVRRRWESAPAARFAQRFTARGTTPPPVAGDYVDVPTGHACGLDAEARIRELKEHRLTLLDATCPFHGGADWRLSAGHAAERLWTITLHYHEWLLELAQAHAASEDPVPADLLCTALQDWLHTCRPGQPRFHQFAWNSYAIATRLGAWYRLYHLLPARFWVERAALHEAFVRSFALQALYLEEHVEWDLRGNHLLRDALGLAWAGRFFTGAAAARWLTTAEELGLAQAQEQVLADGCHFERSPMYHLHALGDLLALALLLRSDAVTHSLRQTWQHMAEPAAWLRHPDGGIPLFNDAALNGACSPDTLLQQGESLGLCIDRSARAGGRYFDTMGMVVWHGAPWSVFFDVGAVGPDYQPGHTHADTLALECSYRGVRLFVDPGTYGYDNDEKRHYDRSTAAHNTVTIDGRDSTEVWHIFRVGRRAYPRAVEVACTANGVNATGSHSGYDSLPGRPQHTRRLEVKDGASLRVIDGVVGAREHRLEGGWLLGPGWSAEPAAGGWSLQREGQRVRIHVSANGGIDRLLETRPYHPSFGVETKVPRLGWRVQGRLPVEVTTLVEGA